MLFEVAVGSGVIYLFASGKVKSVSEASRLIGRFVGRTAGMAVRVRAGMSRLATTAGGNSPELRNATVDFQHRMQQLEMIRQDAFSTMRVRSDMTSSFLHNPGLPVAHATSFGSVTGAAASLPPPATASSLHSRVGVQAHSNISSSSGGAGIGSSTFGGSFPLNSSYPSSQTSSHYSSSPLSGSYKSSVSASGTLPLPSGGQLQTSAPSFSAADLVILSLREEAQALNRNATPRTTHPTTLK